MVDLRRARCHGARCCSLQEIACDVAHCAIWQIFATYVSGPCISACCDLPELLLLRLTVVVPDAHGGRSCGGDCAEVVLIKAASAGSISPALMLRLLSAVYFCHLVLIILIRRWVCFCLASAVCQLI
jgi:hypothetical protein